MKAKIILLVAVLAILGFVLYRKSTEANYSNSDVVGTGADDYNVHDAIASGESEFKANEIATLRELYLSTFGSQAPLYYTASQLETAIKERIKLNKKLEEYTQLTGDDDYSDNDFITSLDVETAIAAYKKKLADAQALQKAQDGYNAIASRVYSRTLGAIDGRGQTFDTVKKANSAATLLLDKEKTWNLQTEQARAAARNAWNSRQLELANLTARFISNFTNWGSSFAGIPSYKEWDADVIQKLIECSESELTYCENLFKSQKVKSKPTISWPGDVVFTSMYEATGTNISQKRKNAYMVNVLHDNLAVVQDKSVSDIDEFGNFKS